MAHPTSTHRQRLQEAAFILRIRENGAAHPVPGHPVAGRDGVFPLPIPPQSIRVNQPTRIGVMDTPYGAVADEQGAAPPQWDIEGQFLLSARSVEGVTLDAYTAQRALEAYIRYYLETNRERARAQQPLLTLEWHDTYQGHSWEVVPLLVPLGQRSNASPLIERWTLKLKGLRPVGPPQAAADPVSGGLEADPEQVIAAFCAEREEVAGA
ncbi:hypothetical protein [Oceanithermus sp.]|uniref:hypothetical protein n=1 Tax=Oceanithermus sp. TaxID=2268145 RepID=UPI00257AC512|nr:hypothetical protein [Oceanithermus sp.]